MGILPPRVNDAPKAPVSAWAMAFCSVALLVTPWAMLWAVWAAHTSCLPWECAIELVKESPSAVRFPVVVEPDSIRLCVEVTCALAEFTADLADDRLCLAVAETS